MQVMATATVLVTDLVFLTHLERNEMNTNPFKLVQVMNFFLPAKNFNLKETGF